MPEKREREREGTDEWMEGGMERVVVFTRRFCVPRPLLPGLPPRVPCFARPRGWSGRLLCAAAPLPGSLTRRTGRVICFVCDFLRDKKMEKKRGAVCASAFFVFAHTSPHSLTHSHTHTRKGKQRRNNRGKGGGERG